MAPRIEWKFRVGDQDALLVRAGDASKSERGQALSAAETRRRVKAWLDGDGVLPPPSLDRLQDLAAACRVGAGASGVGLDAPTLRKRIVEAAAEGRFLLFLRARPKIAPVIRKEKPVEAPAPRAPAPKPKDEKTWIEIALVDEDGDPVPNEAYEIVLVDGSKRTGKLDGKGKARIDGIDPGTCKVLFPGFDGREWFRA